jgi:hypothetical protein
MNSKITKLQNLKIENQRANFLIFPFSNFLITEGIYGSN